MRPGCWKPKRHVPQAATICITFKLLMMGIMVPKHVERTISFAIKTILLHPAGLLFPRTKDDAQSNSHQEEVFVRRGKIVVVE
jgi:hypothetical protein